MVKLTTLDNGLRVVTEQVTHVESVSLGIWLGAGAKDEEVAEYGFSHFLEHMLFKGTERRSPQDIADEIASVGGHINASTSKENTSYYVWVLKEYVPLGLDVLADMLLNSRLDTDELEREKDVVVDEIRRHLDVPEDQIDDVLAEITWAGHRLGHNVLGSEETIRSCSRESLHAYKSRNYSPGRVVISAAGNVEHEAFVGLVRPYFENMPRRPEERSYPPVVHTPSRRVVDKKTESVYFSLASPGFERMNARRYKLMVMDTILGGGMSSRLFQEVREKRGLAYDIGSYSVSYQEGGMFAVYGGTGLRNLDQVLELVAHELGRLKQEPVSEAELDRAKNQLRGSILLSQEHMSARMSRNGKSLLNFGRIIPPEEVIQNIQSVTRESLQELAHEVFDAERTSTAIVGPAEKLEKAVVA